MIDYFIIYLGVIESKVLWIISFNSSNVLGTNILSIPLIIAHINSIAERSGEFGGHFGIFWPFISGPSSQVGIKLPLKRRIISCCEPLDEWALAHPVENILVETSLNLPYNN